MSPLQIFRELLRSIMKRNFALSKLMQKRALRHSRNLRGLAEGGFVGNKQAESQMQSNILWRQLGFHSSW